MSWKTYLEQHQSAHLAQFRDFLAIPSISAQPARSEDVQRAAQWLAARFQQAGFWQSGVLSTAGHPVVYAEHCPYPARPTVLFYGHYDVQPADNPERWNSPPFEPTLVDGRVVARGASDMKGQVMAFLLAAEALIASNSLNLNLKALIEGEEEISSPSLPAFIQQNQERLRCDLIINGDSGQLSETTPLLGLGVRGICALEFDLVGPSHDLHSGTWGGGLQNPLHAMAELVASLHNPDGSVAVKGFYDEVEPLSPTLREWYRQIPWDEAAELKKLGLQEFYGEAGYAHWERTTGRPTLEINGMWGGYTGPGGMTVIPSTAHAKITCRLVPHQNPEKMVALVRAHLEQHLPRGVRLQVRTKEAGAFAFRMSADHPGCVAAREVLAELYGVPPVEVMFGGSVPILATLKQLLGHDPVSFGFGLEDELIHSPNEFFRLSSFEKGKQGYAMLLGRLAQ
ncbi:dipeptidase [uncultured Meiothermus sp.]|jgi:acetylornithine deacetylase/succinyl-diaminopimelate desuccinylase-like protein|uniref:dipeptidase n=1 Tax=uncultured Meiothermus sp. TaxID=157471 RepID=UPI00261EA290|nr:dipeptidase [uncultured Meiothermus sp.]